MRSFDDGQTVEVAEFISLPFAAFLLQSNSFLCSNFIFKEVVFPVNSKRFKNIGFISTRIARTDGVSLEIEKWASVLERNDYVLAGVEPSYLIDIHRLSFQR